MTLLVVSAAPAFGQALKIISHKKEYGQLVRQDSLQQMIEIKSNIPTVVYSLAYATKNNFTGKKLYRDGKQTFLRLPVVRALQKVAEQLRLQGYALKIWDAYRPYSVTQKMWELIGDERYVANPAKGSGHNRGLAVDLTLTQLDTGAEVNMGTTFDHFSDTAHHSFTALPAEALQHRQLLKTTMEQHGFRALPTEWWHYSFPNNNNFDVLDLSFKQLRK